MLIQALLVAIWSGICTIDLFGPQLSLWRPLIAGSVTGLLLGDFTQGMIISAALELMWLGVVGIGAYVPPDVIAGSIIGTAFGIISGQGAVAGIAVAVPVAVASQQLDILFRSVTTALVHRADKAAEEGDFDKMDKYHLLGMPILALTRVIPVFLAVFFGAEYVQQLFSVIPKAILEGLAAAGGILPALGFGMLLALMLNKKIWIFLLLGFVGNVYLKVPTIGLAVIGIIAAISYDMFTNSSSNTSNTSSQGGFDL
jgi:mannose PTS system EIIC component